MEPVSAFQAFRAVKSKAELKKQMKKQQKTKMVNGSTNNGKNVNKEKPNQTSEASKKSNENVKQKKPKETIKSKPVDFESVNSKQKSAKKNKLGKNKEKDVQVEEYTKKASKKDQKKKQNLENYLAKQLAKNQEESDTEVDFNSEEEGNEYEHINSEEFSNEYTVNDSITNGEYDWPNEESPEEPKKKNKKRKNSETDIKAQAPTEELVTKKPKKEEKSQKSFVKTEENDSKKKKSSMKEKHMDSGKISITSVDVKLEPLSPPPNIGKVNSIDEGKRAFQWLLNPVPVDEFFDKYWEKRACLIKRKQSNYFSHLISFEAIDKMLIKNHVEFTKNLDVTSYKNGVRETLNPEGRALPPVVWDHYGQGCSIRLLNPQTFLPQLFTLNTTMQEFFHCLVGANAYLTPPNSQGFAPHYDDIEAFVIQIEGRKRWKLYKPRSSTDILPRDSSHNFTQKEIGKPILEEVLNPGDVLYFPRGTIHQACTEPGYHSLHVTLSVYQRQSYADLFEKMLPLMLKKAIATNVDMRKGLPLTTWQNAGIAYSDINSKERTDLQANVTKLLHKCIRDMPIMDLLDSAVDQVAKKFQHEALPPEILPSEKARTVFGSRNHTNEKGECVCDYDIDERTNVRLLRANILRLVDEEEKIRIYYYLDNSKEYCEYEPNFIEIEANEAASVEVLIKSYPAYIGVSQLPLPSDDQKINLVTALWERGLLMMEKPFK
ncbi:bifunctional lysine-specific demethylase and histidyl-hydroxylase NO66 [Haematobia irritans]|uniref:bifunctional lysine-specific demethylase and histidyl-hydroxylase NO66 n=1 Tax=Haematobia irritans TaxID=7368 RepID=UPI003F50A32C